MNDIAPVLSHESTAKPEMHVEEDIYPSAQGSSSRAQDAPGEAEAEAATERRRPKPKQSYSHTHFRVYTRRWLGLAQLVLLNIVVSWDVSHPYLRAQIHHIIDRSS